MSIKACLAHVQNLPIFSSFTPHEQHMIASEADLVTLAADETLCHEGDAADALYVVVSGRLAVLKSLGDETAEPVDYAGPNRMLGQVALIDGGLRSASIIAEEPSLVLTLPKATFDRQFNAGSRYAFKLLDLILADFTGQLKTADGLLERLRSDSLSPDERLQLVLDQVAAGAEGLSGKRG